MNKTAKIVIAIVAVIAVVIVAVVLFGSKPKTKLDPIGSAEDLTALVDKIYEGLEIEMPMLQTMPIEITETDTVKYMTGLENVDGVEYLAVSEPMMSSQAYSLVLVKVKDGANANAIAKEMNENIDNRKWLCVTAEKVYTTTSGNVVCLVMSNEETAKAVFDNFKAIAGTTGEEYVRVEAESELPDDMMLPGMSDGSELPGSTDGEAFSGEEVDNTEATDENADVENLEEPATTPEI